MATIQIRKRQWILVNSIVVSKYNNKLHRKFACIHSNTIIYYCRSIPLLFILALPSVHTTQSRCCFPFYRLFYFLFFVRLCHAKIVNYIRLCLNKPSRLLESPNRTVLKIDLLVFRGRIFPQYNIVSHCFTNLHSLVEYSSSVLVD